MKKTSLLTAAVLTAVFAIFKPTEAHAQKAQFQTVTTAGAGYSIVGLLLTAFKDAANTVGDVKSSKTPVIWGSTDFGITDRFSVGACYTYQSITLKYNSYTVDSSGNSITVVGDFTDRLSRQSIGIRPLFHFGDNEDLDVYVGARLSYVFWHYNGSRNDPGVTNFINTFGSPVKPQVVLGMRYFFIPMMGFNAEFAIGPTYFMAFGISGRFGGGSMMKK